MSNPNFYVIKLIFQNVYVKGHMQDFVPSYRCNNGVCYKIITINRMFKSSFIDMQAKITKTWIMYNKPY